MPELAHAAAGFYRQPTPTGVNRLTNQRGRFHTGSGKSSHAHFTHRVILDPSSDQTCMNKSEAGLGGLLVRCLARTRGDSTVDSRQPKFADQQRESMDRIQESRTRCYPVRVCEIRRDRFRFGGGSGGKIVDSYLQFDPEGMLG